jgi:hypothetical protein
VVDITDTLLFRNNLSATLNSDVADTDVSLVVTTGWGVEFPNPAAGQYFVVTLHNTLNGDVEVCYCTARSGDILSVERGQEDTVALDFLAANTVVQMRVTRGILEKMLQINFDDADEGNYLQVQADGTVLAVPPEFIVPAGISYLANNEIHTAGKATDPVIINANTATTYTLDLSLSNAFVVNLSANITIAISNALDAQTINVVFKQDGVGGRTVDWAASTFLWPDSTVGQVSTAANAIDMLSARRYEDGSRMLAVLSTAFGAPG